MGEHRVLAHSSGLVPNGLLPDETTNATLVLDTDRWLKAEEQTAKLIARLQPNQSSEERRSAVANYVQRLITNCLSCKVFTFGSVPLKTYLPDGDIDLTAFSDNDDLKDTWATTVCGVLENEAKSENADFCIKEVKFIQAEVKLIKCLVENIVVDISFNQVGGLCTLCFLEEMDKVISRNHLFKRSIMLIKAWCYYESRILGAHYGLISTYALETLVLYIFHVFNNSFSGPLEVLYRFLEFFSNFDWHNYCVSLWGPVPISSLPDMTAEPPRKDNGKLLFSKGFLDNRTAVYSVVPIGQENQSQPFVSKHFNVVDPLRINNNLGRSVSKGNFFRIRSAFTFGAKMLTRLLECPKDAIVSEVNQFFTNTWKRHGTGDRPDILCMDLRSLQPMRTVPVDESSSLKISRNDRNKFENGVLDTSEEHLAVTGQSSHNTVCEALNNHHNVYELTNQSAVSHVQNQISQRKQSNSVFTDQLERNHRSSEFGQSEENQKILKPSYSISNQEQRGRFQFARTRSSPELTETSDLSQASSDSAIEAAKVQTPAKFSTGSTRKNLGSETTGSHSSKSSLDDYVSPKQILSQKNVEVASDANTISNSCHDDFVFTNEGEELVSVSETLEMQQEEQDLVNMMGSSNIHSFNGQNTFPMHAAPLHFPFVSTSMDYFTRNLAGVVPSNLPIVGTPWGSSVQFAQSIASFPVPHYFHAAIYNSKVDSMTEPFKDGSAEMEFNIEGGNHGNWLEDDDKGFNPSDRCPLDDGQQKLECTITSSSTARSSNFGLLSQKYGKSSGKDRSLTRQDFPISFLPKTGKEAEIPSNLMGSNAKPVRLPQAISSRIKYASEDHRNHSSYTLKSEKDRWGRKSASPSVSTSVYGKENSRLQFEGSSDNALVEVDDGIAGWVPLSTMENDMPERISESASLASSSGHEPSENQSDPLIPFTPVLVGTSQQSAFDYSKFVVPLVPYFVVPFGNLASNTRNPDGYIREFDGEEASDLFEITSSDHNIDPVESPDLSEVVMNPTVSRNCGSELSEERTPDILNSDLNGHRQNLVYGRFCQNSSPYMYSTHVIGSPIYLSTHFPLGESRRSVPSNGNNKKIIGHSPLVAPAIPVQPGPDLPTGVFHRNVHEAPRYRGGTGTYLPNPISLRDRHSNSRNSRGNRNHERNDPGDRPRAFDRGHGRRQVERATFHSDRPAAAKNQEEKRWKSHDQGYGNGSSEILDFDARAHYRSSGNGSPSISDGFAEGELYDQRHGSHHRGGSSRSSPGRPSSPN